MAEEEAYEEVEQDYEEMDDGEAGGGENVSKHPFGVG